MTVDLQPWTNSDVTDAVQASAGGYVKIDVPSITSYPLPGHQSTETSWLKDGSLIPQDPHYHVSLSKQLILLDIENSMDQAKFRARFFNPLVDSDITRTESKSFQLSVAGKVNAL